MNEEYEIKIPRAIAPSVIQALLENAIELHKNPRAPKEDVRMALEVAGSLEKQFCGEGSPLAANSYLHQWGLVS